MKRNILKATLVAAVALVASVTVYNAQKPDMEMSDAALANVEALASGESDCHYENGVTNIQKDPTFWYDVKHHYYDCCGVQVDGYDYDENCK